MAIRKPNISSEGMKRRFTSLSAVSVMNMAALVPSLSQITGTRRLICVTSRTTVRQSQQNENLQITKTQVHVFELLFQVSQRCSAWQG